MVKIRMLSDELLSRYELLKNFEHKTLMQCDADADDRDRSLMIYLWSGPLGFNCWTSVAQAFQSWFTVEHSSCFISEINLDLYVCCFDSLMSRGPSCGPNYTYVYMNHSRI